MFAGLWLIGSGVLTFRYRGLLLSLWHEPVIRDPVLIIESDDWGPGPPDHALQLARLIEILTEFRDMSGRRPVMTLGMVLAVPDGRRSCFRLAVSGMCI